MNNDFSSISAWSPTPIGPKIDVVDALPTASSKSLLFLGMDQITRNFLQETFTGNTKKPHMFMHTANNPDAHPPPSSSLYLLFEQSIGMRTMPLVDRASSTTTTNIPRPANATVKSSSGNKFFMLSPAANSVQLSCTIPVQSSSPSHSVCTSLGTTGSGTSSSSKCCHWVDKFNELKQFHKQFGHCLVPNNFRENVKLSQWVKRQRHQYKLRKDGNKTSSLSDEKVEALEEIGFTWSVHKDTWDERFNELQAYKEIHGHANVPKNCKKHLQLSVWVKYQRRHWRLYFAGQRSSMTEDRAVKLTALGFQWNRVRSDGTSPPRHRESFSLCKCMHPQLTAKGPEQQDNRPTI